MVLASQAVALHGRGDPAVAWIAGRQQELVTRAQLAACGLGREAVRHRCRQLRLTCVLPRVFSVGRRALDAHQQILATVLSCGPGAYASHRSGAWLWGLVGEPGPLTHVTVAGRNPGARRAAQLHRARSLDPRETRRLKGIPVTAPVRTLLDFAACEPEEQLEAASAAAIHLGRATVPEIEAEIGLAPSRAGAARLRAVLAQGPSRTRSRAERQLLRLIRLAELPPPRTNVLVCGWEVDAFWEEAGLAVEVDGFGVHRTREAFERDRRRDADLQAAGIATLRFSARRVEERPMAEIARLAATLGTRGLDARP